MFGIGLAKQQCMVLSPGHFRPQGHLATSAGIFNCHSWLPGCGRERILPAGVQWTEVRNADKHPMMYRTDPHNKELVIWPLISTVLGLIDPVLLYFNGTFELKK